MSTWFVYLILKLDILCETVLFFGLSCGLTLAFLIYCYKSEYGKGSSGHSPKKDAECIEAKCVKRWIGICAILFIFSNMLYIVIPNTKQAGIIYLLPKIANNENIQKIPNDIAALAQKQLKQWLEDTNITIEIKKGGK
jgi:hypothetical protein